MRCARLLLAMSLPFFRGHSSSPGAPSGLRRRLDAGLARPNCTCGRLRRRVVQPSRRGAHGRIVEAGRRLAEATAIAD
jgi:hypothetical protein